MSVIEQLANFNDYGSYDSFQPEKTYVQVKYTGNVFPLDSEFNEMQKIMYHLLYRLAYAVAAGNTRRIDETPQVGSATRAALQTQQASEVPGFAGLCMVKFAAGGVRLVEQDASGDRVLTPGFTIIAPQAGGGTQYPGGLVAIAPGWSIVGGNVLYLPELATISGFGRVPDDAGNRKDLVYVRVWKELIDSDEDGAIMHPDLRYETTERVQLCFDFKIVQGTPASVPGVAAAAPSVPPGQAGYDYYELGVIERGPGEVVVPQTGIQQKGAPIWTGNLAITDDDIPGTIVRKSELGDLLELTTLGVELKGARGNLATLGARLARIVDQDGAVVDDTLQAGVRDHDTSPTAHAGVASEVLTARSGYMSLLAHLENKADVNIPVQFSVGFPDGAGAIWPGGGADVRFMEWVQDAAIRIRRISIYTMEAVAAGAVSVTLNGTLIATLANGVQRAQFYSDTGFDLAAGTTCNIELTSATGNSTFVFMSLMIQGNIIPLSS